MQSCAVHTRVVRTYTAKSASQRIVAIASSLHGKRFAHDGAATSEDLEVRHASGARGNFGADSDSRGRGKGAEGGGRRLMKERAHGLGLAQKSLHGCQLRGSDICKSVRRRRVRWYGWVGSEEKKREREGVVLKMCQPRRKELHALIAWCQVRRPPASNRLVMIGPLRWNAGARLISVTINVITTTALAPWRNIGLSVTGTKTCLDRIPAYNSQMLR